MQVLKFVPAILRFFLQIGYILGRASVTWVWQAFDFTIYSFQDLLGPWRHIQYTPQEFEEIEEQARDYIEERIEQFPSYEDRLAAMISDLHSKDPVRILAGVQDFLETFYEESECSYDALVDLFLQVANAGIVSTFAYFLKFTHLPAVQSGAVEVLTIITTSIDKSLTHSLVHHTIMPAFVRLATSSHAPSAYLGIDFLVKAIATCAEFRDSAVKNGALHVLLPRLTDQHHSHHITRTMRHKVAVGVRRICSSDLTQRHEQRVKKKVLPVLVHALDDSDPLILTHVCMSLACLATTNHAITPSISPRRLLDLANHGDMWLCLAALRCVEVLCKPAQAHSHLHLQRVDEFISAGALPILANHLASPHDKARKHACAAVGNKLCGSTAHIQAVMDQAMVPQLLELLTLDGDISVRREAACAVSNLCARATHDQLVWVGEHVLTHALNAVVRHPDSIVQGFARASLQNLNKVFANACVRVPAASPRSGHVTGASVWPPRPKAGPQHVPRDSPACMAHPPPALQPRARRTAEENAVLGSWCMALCCKDRTINSDQQYAHVVCSLPPCRSVYHKTCWRNYCRAAGTKGCKAPCPRNACKGTVSVYMVTGPLLPVDAAAPDAAPACPVVPAPALAGPTPVPPTRDDALPASPSPMAAQALPSATGVAAACRASQVAQVAPAQQRRISGVVLPRAPPSSCASAPPAIPSRSVCAAPPAAVPAPYPTPSRSPARSIARVPPLAMLSPLPRSNSVTSSVSSDMSGLHPATTLTSTDSSPRDATLLEVPLHTVASAKRDDWDASVSLDQTTGVPSGRATPAVGDAADKSGSGGCRQVQQGEGGVEENWTRSRSAVTSAECMQVLFTCALCSITLNSQRQLQKHTTGRKHKKLHALAASQAQVSTMAHEEDAHGRHEAWGPLGTTTGTRARRAGVPPAPCALPRRSAPAVSPAGVAVAAAHVHGSAERNGAHDAALRERVSPAPLPPLPTSDTCPSPADAAAPWAVQRAAHEPYAASRRSSEGALAAGAALTPAATRAPSAGAGGLALKRTLNPHAAPWSPTPATAAAPTPTPTCPSSPPLHPHPASPTQPLTALPAAAPTAAAATSWLWSSSWSLWSPTPPCALSPSPWSPHPSSPARADASSKELELLRAIWKASEDELNRDSKRPLHAHPHVATRAHKRSSERDADPDEPYDDMQAGVAVSSDDAEVTPHRTGDSDGAAAMTQANLDGECIICCEHPVNCIFLECGHMVSCMGCADRGRLHICPMCRVPIQRLIRIYRG